MTSRPLRLITESLGGSPLARAAQNGAAPPEWYPPRPSSADEWRARVAELRSGGRQWWEAIRDACMPRGAALERITRVVERGGVVVTTGQQPGLFGGPVYTWSKAMSALALADEIESLTGVPTAPIFWAATDDTDFAEAAWTAVSVPGGAERLELPRPGADGMRMADVPLPDVTSLLAALRRAAGSSIDGRPLEMVSRSYAQPHSVGSSYVALLRDVLEPMEITVLDAAHESVSRAAHASLSHALNNAAAVDDALRRRAASLRDRGFDLQVAPVDGLSLVFERGSEGKRRVPVDRSAAVAAAAGQGDLSPNVLLRPVIERALLPTIAYLAGPGELAYFAQVSAVADALDMARPLAVPRWSVTIVEPHVAELLERYELTIGDFAVPDAVETRLAKVSWPAGTAHAISAFRGALESLTEDVRSALESDGSGVPPSTADALKRALAWRLQRFERRVTAGVKRRETGMMRDLGTVRGALFPLGIRQERALNLIPLLARHGLDLLESMKARAREHARSLTGGEVVAPVTL